jgi:dTDP-4-dehydrorhamnose reductase
MMGSGPKKDKKFVNKIFKQLVEGRKEIFVVNDKDGTPTYTRDFVHTVLSLFNEGFWGIYNTVCEGQTSRLEVAQEILKILNLSGEVIITPVNSDYFKNEFFALRPDSERLITKKLNLRGLNKMRDWKVSLKEYLETYFK